MYTVYSRLILREILQILLYAKIFSCKNVQTFALRNNIELELIPMTLLRH